LHIQDIRGTRDDLFKLRDLIKIQMKNDAESAAKRRRDESRTRRSSDQRKFRQFQFYGTRGGALADHYVQIVIFHRRIEYLFDGRIQAVDLVDKEHVAFFEICEYRSKIAGFFDYRPGGRPKSRTH